MNRTLTVDLETNPDGMVRGSAIGIRALTELGRAAVRSGGQIASGIEGGTGRARNAMGQFLGQSNSVAGQLQVVFAKAFAVDRILAFGEAIGTVSGKFEKYQAVLTNALGSRSQAKGSMSMLSDIAGFTPYSMDELTASFVKFVNRGLIPTRQQIINLGDLAASQGKGFDQLTEAVLDAQTGEFERLKEFGVRASKSGDQVTLSFKGITQTVKNSSGAITDAIIGFGKLGGVAGGMAAISETLEGQVSNLGDSFDRLLVAIGGTGVAGGMKLALGAAGQLLGVFTDLIAQSPAEDLQNQKTALNGLVGAIALANDNEGLRLSLIQKLKSEYPEFLGSLSAESVSTDLLARRLADVNAQYEKKIRIALGEAKIKKANEEFTQAINQQQAALELLAKEAGISIVALEKLSAAQRIALAKDIADKKRGSSLQNSYFGVAQQTPTDYIASALESGLAKQQAAQAELNRLLTENNERQADLTQTTVTGYQAQIAQIREKIKLHQVEKKEGLAEIKRLQDQILIAQGKPLPMAATPSTGKSTGTRIATATQTGDLAIAKRFEAELEAQIQNAGGKGVDKKIQQLKDIRGYIEDIQAITSKNQKSGIPAISQITDPKSQAKVDGILRSFVMLADATPGLFAKTGIENFLDKTQQAEPTLEFYKKKIEEIKALTIALSLNGLKLPPEILDQLKLFKQLVADAENAAAAADSKTNSGSGGGDEAKWTAKAEARIAAMKAAGQDVKKGAAELGQDMKEAHDNLANAAAQVLEGIGEGLAQGQNPLKTALSLILGMLGDFMIKLGTAMLVGGALLEAAETAFPFVKPFLKAFGVDGVGGVVAGGALVVGGGVVKGLATNITSHEKGGLAKGESIIRVGESAKALKGGGELIAPIGEGARLMTMEMQRLGAFSAQPTAQMQRLSPTGGMGKMQIELTGEVRQEGQTLLYAITRAVNHSDYFHTKPDWAFNGRR
ncbi:hypothetical protein GO755_00055 [Spirosoma sp. HMF4905]|uniref:Tape measure protein n=1 Tax=Spirosoma arboris TaxID=2682092 RepID=A0A7K1S3L1_9BACT|nr:hypothetical protein [Spirosoma arboris]MVM28404.1 hypothetical protein [Spirosoma arboris]